jgi:hypothetical protein
MYKGEAITVHLFHLTPFYFRCTSANSETDGRWVVSFTPTDALIPQEKSTLRCQRTKKMKIFCSHDSCHLKLYVAHKTQSPNAARCSADPAILILWLKILNKHNEYILREQSPRGNYTDRATVCYWGSATFADRECHVVSVTDPYGRTIAFVLR